MRVLVLGSGGREHALSWKLAQAEGVERVYVAPGNAGIAMEERLESVAIEISDIAALLEFATKTGIDLTVVGPEVALVSGVVDAFSAAGFPCFGPSKVAAQLEGSKAYAKEFMLRHQIPTAAYATFTDVAEAQRYIEQQGAPIVVKADGLAAGKGVIVAQSVAEAKAAVEQMLADNQFGEAGSRVVIEEFLSGEEVSFICMVDGTTVLPMASSQDHKAAYEGDAGPNTGGMGAYSPAPIVTPALEQRIMEQVIYPTVRGLEADKCHYKGFLYAGLMIGADGIPKVLEYNCRLGDPETQPLLLRLKSNLAKLCLAALEGRLAEQSIEWDPRSAMVVVLAAAGYPGAYRKGDPIRGLGGDNGVTTKLFHAGTALQQGEIVSNGGRVLGAAALGETLAEANEACYRLAESVSFTGVWYRRDIGHRAL
ncbi:phosphoribosylamine--glycine ligase [Ectothiorhodospiraceae bacterium BW-2]|nr:phosphoribosylamine--glycine ligase [Ectothiorhodospiraceae bacterium BW-2]